MNDITVITPPDFLFNDAFSILLICPSDSTKTVLNQQLLDFDVPLNLMVYETPLDQIHQIDWLLTAVKISNTVILDLDHCDTAVRQFASYIIAQPKTFFLTNHNETPYNLISNGRVYDFAWLESVINRGKNAQTKE
jgi:hypothetical protein